MGLLLLQAGSGRHSLEWSPRQWVPVTPGHRSLPRSCRFSLVATLPSHAKAGACMHGANFPISGPHYFPHSTMSSYAKPGGCNILLSLLAILAFSADGPLCPQLNFAGPALVVALLFLHVANHQTDGPHDFARSTMSLTEHLRGSTVFRKSFQQIE